MYGLAVCDYTALPKLRNETTRRDILAAFAFDYDTSLRIAVETLKEKEAWFAKKVDVISEKSESSGLDLWAMILTRAGQTPSGDYWGSVDFQDFFERSYALKISTSEDVARFENALKNKRRSIRKAEEKHRKIFEDLIIDCAVESKALGEDPEKAAELRSWFEQDRPSRIAQFLKDEFEAHSKVMRSMTAFLKEVAAAPNRRRRSSIT